MKRKGSGRLGLTSGRYAGTSAALKCGLVATEFGSSGFANNIQVTFLEASVSLSQLSDRITPTYSQITNVKMKR